ncbi:16S rRNA (guanine(527)-N(7))-methyltransferase RsmG [Sphingomonas sinipercae]|uniref:Ribosomal RNA small subunit methyltransferase G n=1 Tax=Sphingomonas sinipercae TaxID=2714944 RepID=A0A6G7ZKX0_9SPHN|nr:16S rRNA (guanine(527)-N(7))-methyltransferase RsmG [Sphingomonas sinipercae]QIL01560.1 16S rRNA (guanine(527)-N(7))-methyltransferase RsmG [Sphingomonas sinipercae]
MIEALSAVAGKPVSRETLNSLRAYEDILRSEAGRQNLVSATTLDSLWTRHILDSAQLVALEPAPGASWVDIGSGAGLPGIVIALLVDGHMTLVEPRRLRADFLKHAVAELRLGDRVTVVQAKAQGVAGRFDTITGRAVAPLDQFLSLSTHLSTKNTRWVLPKGRSAESELAEAGTRWQCEAESVPSRTDPDARILLLRNVKPRGRA